MEKRRHVELTLAFLEVWYGEDFSELFNLSEIVLTPPPLPHWEGALLYWPFSTSMLTEFERPHLQPCYHCGRREQERLNPNPVVVLSGNYPIQIALPI